MPSPGDCLWPEYPPLEEWEKENRIYGQNIDGCVVPCISSFQNKIIYFPAPKSYRAIFMKLGSPGTKKKGKIFSNKGTKIANFTGNSSKIGLFPTFRAKFCVYGQFIDASQHFEFLEDPTTITDFSPLSHFLALLPFLSLNNICVIEMPKQIVYSQILSQKILYQCTKIVELAKVVGVPPKSVLVLIYVWHFSTGPTPPGQSGSTDAPKKRLCRHFEFLEFWPVKGNKWGKGPNSNLLRGAFSQEIKKIQKPC